MKTLLYKIALLVSLSPLLLVSKPLSAQLIDVNIPGKDMPAFVRIFENGNIQRYVIPDWEENPVISIEGQDETYYFDLGNPGDKNKYPVTNQRNDLLEWYEPGVPIEGDLPCDMAYSKDGSMFAVIYQNSDNVIFYNAITYEILATVSVARQPLDIKFGENHAYICCHLAQGIVVISLDDFSVSNYVQVDGTPCQLELSPTEDTAYIACDSWLDGWMVAMDLRTNEMIYKTNEPYFHHYGWGGNMGRESYFITKFNLSPKGDRFISAYTHPIWPAIFNAYTGQLIDTLRFGGYRGAKYSTTGDTLYIYSNHEDSVKMYRMNTADNTFIDSIYAYAESMIGFVDYSDLSISHDGSKVLINDEFNSRFCLFDFNTHSCQVISEGMLYMDAPTYSSFDGEYGITCLLTQVKIIDFNSGAIYNAHPAGVNTGLPLCVSTKENKLVVGNQLTIGGGYNEMIDVINFKDIDNITLDTAIICGQLPEADVSASAVLSNDGEKIYSSNLLNKNFSVIDLEEELTDTMVFINHMTGIKVIPGTDYALIYGDDLGRSKIMSLTDYSILAEMITGPVDNVFITSDGHTAYTVGYTGGSEADIKKITLDGASSAIIDQAFIDASHSSIDYIVQESVLNTTTALSPDEQLLLLGYDDPNLGPVMNIVDAANLNLLTSVNIPFYDIFGFAFTDDSKRAVAVGVSTQVPIIYLDRENSFLENVTIIDSYSFSADFNPVDGMFYVLARDNFFHKVDPLTGEIVESFPTWNNYNWQIKIDKRGIPMVLTVNSLIYDRDVYTMPGVSTTLTYDLQADLFISPVPGPDVICVFDPKQVGIRQFKPGQENDVSIFPNPAKDQVIIKSNKEITRVKVSNIAGTEVYSGDFKERIIELPIGNLAPGVYVIDIITKSDNYSKKFIVR